MGAAGFEPANCPAMARDRFAVGAVSLSYAPIYPGDARIVGSDAAEKFQYTEWP